MKEIFKIISILTLTCVICAFSLTITFQSLTDAIAKNAEKDIENAISKLTPTTETIDKIPTSNRINIYTLKDSSKEQTGYAFIAEGQGYQGKIKILTITDLSLNKIDGIEIIESVETPGLGSRIQENFFTEQFKNLSITGPITYTKDTPKKNQIQAITGATVSSKSVVNILNEYIKRAKQEINI